MFYNFCGLLGLRKSLFKLGVILCNLLVYTTMVDLSKTTVSVVVLISFTRIALEMFSLVVFVY
jgi:predicted membrane chloride channel (bestrophin family)